MNVDIDPSATPSAGPGIRNTPYYLESVIFRVDGQLFKVPQYRFQTGSSLFRTMFSLPQGNSLVTGIDEDGNPMMKEGSCDEFPIDLQGVSASDFQRFLGVLYPLDTSMDTKKTLDEWKSVLKIANMWSFREIRRFAIEKMTPFVSSSPTPPTASPAASSSPSSSISSNPFSSIFPPMPSPYNNGSTASTSTSNTNSVNANTSASSPTPLPIAEKVLLARECLVPSWLLEAYDDLVRRLDGISDEEAQILGSIATARLFREREFCRDSNHYTGRAAPVYAPSAGAGGQPLHNPSLGHAILLAHTQLGQPNAAATAFPFIPPNSNSMMGHYGGNQTVCSHLKRLRNVVFMKELDDMMQEDG